MLCIGSSVRIKTFQSRLRIPHSCKREPGDFHSPNLFRYCFSRMAVFKLILFSFGGSLPDGRSIAAFSSTFSFFTDCYLLRAMRINRCEQHTSLPRLR